jgi:AcrR family transcriptional regulator
MDVQEDPRGRKRAPARIAQILDIADRLVIEAGALPISMKRVGDAMGASRALVYAYFADADQLAEAVLERQMAWLAEAGLTRALDGAEFGAGVLAAGEIYLDHVARRGPVVHLTVRDITRGRGEAAGVGRPHVAMLRKLARAARRDLRLSPHEALVLAELLVTIPEETGRLVFEGALDLADAHALCARLLSSSVDSIRPRGARPA